MLGTKVQEAQFFFVVYIIYYLLFIFQLLKGFFAFLLLFASASLFATFAFFLQSSVFYLLSLRASSTSIPALQCCRLSCTHSLEGGQAGGLERGTVCGDRNRTGGLPPTPLQAMLPVLEAVAGFVDKVRHQPAQRDMEVQTQKVRAHWSRHWVPRIKPFA